MPPINHTSPAASRQAPLTSADDAELRERATCPITGDVTVQPMRGPEDRHIVDGDAAATWAKTCERAGRPVTHPLHRGPMTGLQPDRELQLELARSPWVVNSSIPSPAGLTEADIEAFVPRAGEAEESEWRRHIRAAKHLDRDELAASILERVIDDGPSMSRADLGDCRLEMLKLRVDVALDDKNPDLAEALCLSMPESLQRHPNGLLLQGDIALVREQWSTAIAVFERVLHDNERNPTVAADACSGLACTYDFRGGQGDKDLEHFYTTLRKQFVEMDLERDLRRLALA